MCAYSNNFLFNIIQLRKNISSIEDIEKDLPSETMTPKNET